MSTIIADMYAVLGLRANKKEWAAGDRLVGGLKRALFGLGAIIGVTSLKGLIDSTVHTAAANVEMAQKMGISIEKVQELSYAAKASSTDIGALRMGFQKLGIGLKEAEKGQGGLKDAFKKLGISMKDPAVKSKDMDAILLKVADKFKAMPDGMDKTSAAVGVFGRAGANLIPFLNEGSEGITKLREEAVRLGVVVGGETAKRLKKFGDDQQRLKARVTGLTNKVVTALLPTLEKLLVRLEGWIERNGDLIASGLEMVISGLIKAFDVLATAVGFIVDVVQALINNTEILIPILTALGFIMLKTAIKTAAAWAMAALPFVLMAATIAGIAWVVRDLVKAFTGGNSRIVWFFKKIWEGIKGVGRFFRGVFVQFGRDVAGAWDRIKEFFSDIGAGIRDAFVQAGRDIRDFFVAVFEWIADKVQKVGSAVVDALNPFSGPGFVGAEAAIKEQEGKRQSGDMRFAPPTRQVPDTGPNMYAPAPVNANATITINAPHANAQEVLDLANASFADSMAATLRHAADSTETQ